MSMLMTLTSTLTTLVRRAKFLDTGNIRWRFREGDKHPFDEWAPTILHRRSTEGGWRPSGGNAPTVL